MAMRLFDRIWTRRRHQRRFSDLAPHVQRRLALVARELRDEEDAIAAALNLPEPPRLLMIDEEESVVVGPGDRLELMAASR
jgi:hypothetical protein